MADVDIYFFNRYDLSLQNQHLSEPLKQSFYINAKQDNVTLKEGYNLLSGRAVYKELSTREGPKYNAWIQLDFKQTEATWNYRIKQFHSNYGFDLQKEVQKLPLKELLSPESTNNLLRSLERGNRQAVILADDSGKKLFIEAAPQFKTLNIYDNAGQRIRSDQTQNKHQNAPTQETTENKNAKQLKNKTLKQVGNSKKPKQSIK